MKRKTPARKTRKTTVSIPRILESGGSVTGGTGDIKPAILTLATQNASAVAQYISSQFAFPVPRFGTAKDKATITELLWIHYYLGFGDLADIANTHAAFLSTNPNLRTDGTTCTSATLQEDLLDPTVFGFAMDNVTVTTSGAMQHLAPLVVDLTDRNGNGILIATDRITLYYGDIGGTNVSRAIAKIAYRIVDVGLEEYVGILASQQ